MCLRDGRQHSDSIVSLSTSPHSTAHLATGFLPPPLHPSRLHARKAASGPSQDRTEATLWGCKRASRLEDEDQGSPPSPGPKTLIWLASRPTEGPPWLGTTSGQEGRRGLGVSAAVMAVARLRPLRNRTMEEVYNRAHTHRRTHAHTASIHPRPCRPSETERHE